MNTIVLLWEKPFEIKEKYFPSAFSFIRLRDSMLLENFFGFGITSLYGP